MNLKAADPVALLKHFNKIQAISGEIKGIRTPAAASFFPHDCMRRHAFVTANNHHASPADIAFFCLIVFIIYIIIIHSLKRCMSVR